MSHTPHSAKDRLFEDDAATFMIRWRGRPEGPYPASVIEAKLNANQIGLLHEILIDDRWLTLRDFVAEREAAVRTEREAKEEEARRLHDEAERQAQEREEQRRADLAAEVRYKASQLEVERAKLVHGLPDSPSAQSSPSIGWSGLRVFGVLLMIIGLVIVGFFFLGFDPSVETGSGRVVNLGLLADRQNGIIAGIGLGVVGAIMVATGSRGRT